MAARHGMIYVHYYGSIANYELIPVVHLRYFFLSSPRYSRRAAQIISRPRSTAVHNCFFFQSSASGLVIVTHRVNNHLLSLLEMLALHFTGWQVIVEILATAITRIHPG